MSDEISRAQADEAATLSAIAWSAKAHWGYPRRWLEHWRKLLTISPEFIEANGVFRATRAGETVAFYALLERPSQHRLEHLWVLPEWMGQGIGRSLFEHAAARARARGARSLTTESDPHAEAFYCRFGAVVVGSVASEIEGERRELPLLRFDLR